MTSTGSQPLRVLMIEDSEDDAVLTLRALRGAGYAPELKRVETRQAMADALANEPWSVILCDYSMPTFDAPSALAVLKESGKDIPFIIVSGMAGEEAAIVAMRNGANDYFLKSRLALLGASIARELRDVDERRRRREAEAKLARERERFRLLVEHSSDFVSLVEPDLTVRYQSPTIERVLGHTRSNVESRSFLELVHPEERAEVRRVFTELLASPGGTERIEFRARDKEGSWRPVESICHNRMDDPEVRAIITSTRDMTERNAVEEAERARVQAELASRTKSAFLANMSHELRTPLNAIIGFSELMEQGLAGPLSERQREYVSSVVQSGRHLLNLVNDILDLSKIEAGRMELHREWMQLETVVEAVGRVAQGFALKQDVLLLTCLDENLPDVFIDPVRIKQVLYNVLSNAIKFTPSRGYVELNAKEKDGGVEITISDTGIGIAPEDLPRLFREFEQIETRGEKPEGTGLGLTLTKRLIEMHGGKISVSSEQGKGTTVTLTLPVLRRIGASEAPRGFSAGDEGDAQVLIIEDDSRSAELLARHLRAAGAAVAVTTTGEGGLRLAASLKPRAITLDLLIPGDGWKILRRLKVDPATSSIPVVVISVLDEAPRAMALGADAYLRKPVTRDAVLHALVGSGISFCPVAGVNVLLVGSDSPEARDLWEKLHEVGCQVERAVRLAQAMTDTPCDLAIVVASADGSLPLDAGAGPIRIPVLIFGAGAVPPALSGALRLRPEHVGRPELLVRRLRAALERRPSGEVKT